VTIVLSENEGYGYLLDSNDKSSISKYINKCGGKGKAKVIVTPNEDFQLTLLDLSKSPSSNSYSSPIGQNILVKIDKTIPINESKDNDIETISFYTNINFDLLYNLILHLQFDNGVCKQPLKIMRKNGKIGLIHEIMTEYQKAREYIEFESDTQSNQTSAWKIGTNYISKTRSDTYFGKIYNPIIIENIYKTKDELENLGIKVPNKLEPDNNNGYWVTLFDLDQLRRSHMVLNDLDLCSLARLIKHDDETTGSNISNEIYFKSIEETLYKEMTPDSIFNALMYDLDKHCTKLKSQDVSSNQHQFDFIKDYVPFKGTDETINSQTLPYRKQGKINLPLTKDPNSPEEYYSILQNYINVCKIKIHDLMKSGYGLSYTTLSNLIRSTNGKISDIDREIIQESLNNSRLVPQKVIGNEFIAVKSINEYNRIITNSYFDIDYALIEILNILK
jgi:hypothetical protein